MSARNSADGEESKKSEGLYRFERESRTPNSEAYAILQDDQLVGRVDLHFTSTVVQATLAVEESLTDDEIEGLIEMIDDDLVVTADTPREDFIVAVYQGRSLGTYSDTDFDNDGDEGLTEEANGSDSG